jgi:competence protein ComEA
MAICFVAICLCSLGFTASAEDVLKGKTVNINTATVEEIAEIPLVTQEMAEGIVEYREDSGDFQSLDELLQIDGFTRKLYLKIKTFFLLEGLGGDECTC